MSVRFCIDSGNSGDRHRISETQEIRCLSPEFLAVIFRVEQVRQSRASVGAVAIGIELPAFDVFRDRLVTQADLMLVRTQLDDLEISLVA